MPYCVCIVVYFFMLMTFSFSVAVILLVHCVSSLLQLLCVRDLTSKHGFERIWMTICCLNPTDKSIRLDTVILVAVHRRGLELNYSTLSYTAASAASVITLFSNITINLCVTHLTRASPQPCHPFLLYLNVSTALKPRHVSTVAEDSVVEMRE